MQTFTIRDIENLTGIKAHTIRIWEQRYDFFISKRKESQHRFFDNDDLKKLLKIAFLYHNGWKVSKIASLSDVQINSIVRETKIIDGNYLNFVARLLEASIDFDEQQFINILNEIQQHIGFEKMILNVCFPFLKKTGLLWSTNNVIPAQEHFSSYIIQNRIISETDKLSFNAYKPEIALICPQGEFHELPLLFINYLFRKNGWSVLFLGSNISFEDMKHIELIPQIQFLYIHLLTNFTGLEAEDYFEALCNNHPGKKIIASGTAIMNVHRKNMNMTLLKSDEAIIEFIESGPGKISL